MSYANRAPVGALPAPRHGVRASAGAFAVTVAAVAAIVTGWVVIDATDTAPPAVTVVDGDWPTRAHPTGGGGNALNQGPKTVEGLNGKKLVPGS